MRAVFSMHMRRQRLRSRHISSIRRCASRARALAITELDAATRQSVGEVFKRATNIAASAADLDDSPIAAPPADAHESEKTLFESFTRLKQHLSTLSSAITGAARPVG